MTINIIYICTTLVAIYYGSRTYIHTKNKLILAGIIILTYSIGIEIWWLNTGNFIINTTGSLWVGIDLARSILMIYFSNLVYKIK